MAMIGSNACHHAHGGITETKCVQAVMPGATLADVLPQLDAEDAAPTSGLDLERTSASRLARLNTVARSTPHVVETASEEPSEQTNASSEQAANGVHRSSKRSRSANSTVFSDLEPALSQLLQQPETQPSTGTPMARDLTEALTALASNKRLLSSMQASRSFSSPDLLSLAQHLHDSGQWEAVADRLQQEGEQASRDSQAETQDRAGDHAESPAKCGNIESLHGSYGTVVGRSRQERISEEGNQHALQWFAATLRFKSLAGPSASQDLLIA